MKTTKKVFKDGKAVYWMIALNLALPGLGTMASLAIPLIPLSMDTAAALAAGIKSARRKAADQLTAALAHRRQVEADRLAEEKRLKAEADRPKPKTRVELAQEAADQYAEHIDLTNFIQDDFVREMAIAAAERQYRDRLVEIMTEA